MTSLRKILANRRNAQLSTGPKTAAGRLRSSQNARRHGLSVPISADPKLLREAKALALEIISETSSPDLRSHANLITDAQVDLMRVRQVKHQMLLSITRPANEPHINSAQSEAATSSVYAAVATAFVEHLARLDRYERRACSRRKAAICAFDYARQKNLTIEGGNLAERSQKDE